MADRDEMRGVLFKHDKQGIESRPDWSGKCQIHGKRYYIDLWNNQSQGIPSTPYKSLRFKPVPEESMPPSRPQSSVTKTDFDDDDIPF
jgi:hypothetical protein